MRECGCAPRLQLHRHPFNHHPRCDCPCRPLIQLFASYLSVSLALPLNYATPEMDRTTLSPLLPPTAEGVVSVISFFKRNMQERRIFFFVVKKFFRRLIEIKFAKHVNFTWDCGIIQLGENSFPL